MIFQKFDIYHLSNLPGDAEGGGIRDNEQEEVAYRYILDFFRKGLM